jgi:hypothetical protein
MNAPGLLAILSISLAAGCGMPLPLSCPAGAQAMATETLYFGTKTPDGEVSGEAWKAFLDAEVAARFPEGLSVWRAEGRWRSASGAIVAEPSYILNIVHAADAKPEEAIRAVIAAYKARFRQESVLRVAMPACASF